MAAITHKLVMITNAMRESHQSWMPQTECRPINIGFRGGRPQAQGSALAAFDVHSKLKQAVAPLEIASLDLNPVKWKMHLLK